MRRFLVLLFCLVAAAAPVRAGKVVDVPVDEFHPTQPSVGRAAAMLYIKDWKHEAKRRGLSLKKYAKKVLQRKLDEKLTPAVIDPQGRVLNTDAHHHITAMLELKKKTGVTLVARANVVEDYRGATDRAFANDFVNRLKKGWFPSAEDATTPLQKLRSLPENYAAMENDPLRSAVEAAFDRLGLDGKMFSDYVEFRVGEALVREGLYERLSKKGLIDKHARSIPDGDVFDKKIVKQIVKLMRKPAIREMLLANARSQVAAKTVAAALE